MCRFSLRSYHSRGSRAAAKASASSSSLYPITFQNHRRICLRERSDPNLGKRLHAAGNELCKPGEPSHLSSVSSPPTTHRSGGSPVGSANTYKASDWRGVAGTDVPLRHLKEGVACASEVNRSASRHALAAAGKIARSESVTIPAGLGRLSSRAARALATARPPPAEPPVITIPNGSEPWRASSDKPESNHESRRVMTTNRLRYEKACDTLDRRRGSA